MFEDSLIVSSAVSAFNNAALVAPAFFWNAVLCLPLFAAVYWFGRRAVDVLGLRKYITKNRVIFWCALMTAAWALLTGGDYNVLRDGASVLPWLMAGVLAVSMFVVGVYTRALSFPLWYGAPDASRAFKWFANLSVLGVLCVPIILSNVNELLVPGLQIVALCLGFLAGRHCKCQIQSEKWAIFAMFGAVVAILMQPEFFRFGQLGNLTPVHLVWVLLTGVILVAAMMLVIVRPHGRIHRSAFIKIKWLLRLVAGLCAVLFVLTEAVPLFLITMLVCAGLFSVSLWHAERVSVDVINWTLAVAICGFGVLVGVPTITALGILLLATDADKARPAPWFLL